MEIDKGRWVNYPYKVACYVAYPKYIAYILSYYIENILNKIVDYHRLKPLICIWNHDPMRP